MSWYVHLIGSDHHSVLRDVQRSSHIQPPASPPLPANTEGASGPSFLNKALTSPDAQQVPPLQTPLDPVYCKVGEACPLIRSYTWTHFLDAQRLQCLQKALDLVWCCGDEIRCVHPIAHSMIVMPMDARQAANITPYITARLYYSTVRPNRGASFQLFLTRDQYMGCTACLVLCLCEHLSTSRAHYGGRRGTCIYLVSQGHLPAYVRTAV